jgi:hypothetical protein
MLASENISTSSLGYKINQYEQGRLALEIGPVLLPLSHKSLDNLSQQLAISDQQFSVLQQDGLVYLNCGKLMLCLSQDESQDLAIMTAEALEYLKNES